MQFKRLQGLFSWVVVFSELSHIFCCVLPSVFSIMTVLVGIGVLGAVPVWMDGMHEAMHDWEIPIIVGSGTVLMFGWIVHFISKRIDCHESGCGHGPCAPKKQKMSIILKIATFLFVMNVIIYATVHVTHDQARHDSALSGEHHEDAHDLHHDH